MEGTELTPEQTEEVNKRLKYFSKYSPFDFKLYGKDIEKFRQIGKEIAEKRLIWLEENLENVQPEGFSENTVLFDLIWLKYMNIDPKDVSIWNYFDCNHGIEWTKIECMNFCPYLEIARLFKFDTKVMCEHALQDSVQAMMDRWLEHTQSKSRGKVLFRRNIPGCEPKARPYQDRCDEYIIRRLGAEENMERYGSGYFSLEKGEWLYIPI